ISRKHAVVRAQGASLTIEDLGSRNGTSVQGQRLAPSMPCALEPGATIELGNVTLLVHRAAPSKGSAARAERAAGTGEPGVTGQRMRRLYALLAVIAPSPLPIVILGETGTGKEVFAEEVHARSRRADEPFLKINCASLTGSLLESELFGYEKGAFTGAVAA